MRFYGLPISLLRIDLEYEKKIFSDGIDGGVRLHGERPALARPLYQNYFAAFDFSSPSISPGLTANAIMQLRHAPGSGGYTDRSARRIRHK